MPVTAAFFLMLREGLEAALIVGIIAAYVVRVGRPEALRPIGVGVIAALAVSVGMGVAVALTVGALPLVLRATIEGGAALAAVLVLTWMLFWMRRAGRAMKGELEREVAVALAIGSTTALAGLAFVAVAREGLETVLFLFAIGASSGEVASLLLASVAGLAVAVAIGWAIFRLGTRIDLRRFFTLTGVVLIFVSAGLVAYALRELNEAGFVPTSAIAFDLSSILPETSVIGSLLAGMFGYRSTPRVIEVVGYLLYLIPVLTLFVSGQRRARPVAVTAAVGALVIVLAGCGGTATTSGSPAASVPGAGQVEVGASEYAFDPSTVAVDAGSVTFHVTNRGSVEHEFEILQGESVIDEIEGLVPGLDRSLTVDLASGAYTYVCRLPGHEEQGMTGTLTVG